MKRVMLLVTVILAVFSIYGCKKFETINSEIINETQSAVIPESTAIEDEEEPATTAIENEIAGDSVVVTQEASSTEDDRATIIEIEEINIEVLSNGLTLSQLASYLEGERIDVLEELGDEFADPIGWNRYVEEFYYEGKGINLLSRYDGKILNAGFSSIECDTDMVNLRGITKDMDFAEIQKQLAPTEVVRIDNGLDVLASYELRYIINGVRLKFVSGDENGSERFRLKFVKDFDLEDEFRRITIEDIKFLFSLSETELVNAITPKSAYGRSEDYVSFKWISFSFVGEELESISLGEIYEVEGIRWFDKIEEVPKVLGKKKLVMYSSDEGDSFYELEYSYGDIRVVFWANDFNHRIDYIQIYDVNLKVFQ